MVQIDHLGIAVKPLAEEVAEHRRDPYTLVEEIAAGAGNR